MIKAFLRTFFVMIILIGAAFAFLLTPMGLRLSIDAAADLLPGKLTIQKVSGIIIGPLTLQGLHYQDNQQIIDIKKIALNWHPIDLFKKELHIQTAEIDDLHMIANNSDLPRKWTVDSVEQAFDTLVASLKRRSLPFHVIVEKSDFNNLYFNDRSSQVTIATPHLLLRAILTSHKWDAEIASTLTKPQPLQLHFLLHGHPRHYELNLTLNGQKTDWQVVGHGDLDSLTLQTPQKMLFNGTLDAGFYIHWKHILKWTGTINANKIDLSLISPHWIKWASINIHSDGVDSNPLTFNNQADINTPFGNAHVIFNYNNAWHIQWKSNIESLPDWITTIKGNVQSQGKIDGDMNNPHFSIALNGQTLGKENSSAKINLDGDFLNHTLLATFHLEKQKIHIAANGHFDPNNEQWNGNLKKFTIALDRSITLTLKNSAALSATPTTFTLSPLCLESSSAGNICLKGELNNNKINSVLQLTVLHFEFLHRWLHLIHIPSGQLQGEFKINGTFLQPNITGKLQLNQGNIYFPRLNLTLNNITTTVKGDGAKLNFKARAFSQNVPLNLVGDLDLSQEQFHAEGELTTQNAIIINTQEYLVRATSDLKAQIKNRDIYLTGNIIIPSAAIQPNDFETTNTLPEHDIVYVGDVIPPSNPFWQVHNNVSVKFGDHILVTASGAKIQLGGQLQLTQEPNADMFGTGDILIKKGTFSVYGQTLTVEPDSYLSYQNNLLNNPSLNVKASKTISNVQNMGIANFTQGTLVVGIALHGTVNQPKISFFSNRASLSQADILSYIILGYGNNSNAPGSTDFLLRALAAVKITTQGILGKENIASQIQSGLGLSELGIESQTTVDSLGNPINQQSAFVVGKSLTKRFYMRVSFGILSPVNVYQFGYILNDHWSLQSDSSTLGNGADVLYTFTRD